jgi:hypothetical protein
LGGIGFVAGTMGQHREPVIVPGRKEANGYYKGSDMAKPNFIEMWNFNLGRSRLQILPSDSTIFVVEHYNPIFQQLMSMYSV